MISSRRPYGKWIFRWKISQQLIENKKKEEKKNEHQPISTVFIHSVTPNYLVQTIFIRHLPSFPDLKFSIEPIYKPICCFCVCELTLCTWFGFGVHFFHWNASVAVWICWNKLVFCHFIIRFDCPCWLRAMKLQKKIVCLAAFVEQRLVTFQLAQKEHRRKHFVGNFSVLES